MANQNEERQWHKFFYASNTGGGTKVPTWIDLFTDGGKPVMKCCVLGAFIGSSEITVKCGDQGLVTWVNSELQQPTSAKWNLKRSKMKLVACWFRESQISCLQPSTLGRITYATRQRPKMLAVLTSRTNLIEPSFPGAHVSWAEAASTEEQTSLLVHGLWPGTRWHADGAQGRAAC